MAPAFLRRAAYEDNAEDLPAGRMGMTWEIVVIVVLGASFMPPNPPSTLLMPLQCSL